MIGAVGVLAGRSEPDGGTGARCGLGAADLGGAGPGSGEGDSSGNAWGDGPVASATRSSYNSLMAQPPAPYTNPGLPDKLIVSSPTTSDRLIAILILLTFLILMAMMLSIGMLSSNYDSGGESLGTAFLVFILFALLFVPIVAYFVWLIRKEQGTRTVVDSSGLLLEKPGAQALFIPWQNAHGHITVKTVSQYVPGTSTPAMMSLILVVFDQEEIVLPGSVLNSYPLSSRAIGQQSYATAMQILAYDPWGQKEPLMQSDNTFTPYMPQNMYAARNMYMFQNIMRT